MAESVGKGRQILKWTGVLQADNGNGGSFDSGLGRQVAGRGLWTSPLHIFDTVS